MRNGRRLRHGRYAVRADRVAHTILAEPAVGHPLVRAFAAAVLAAAAGELAVAVRQGQSEGDRRRCQAGGQVE